ncbi:MAG: bifunctional fucokinase/L-fucose-1-P-guanylyltransferase [Verrucomicrobiales bacterium]|nr:bifunctional fucokinase/L-fucose-1-P-guanylyltransferase [Verrucomicrobiales bacterium]
MAPHFAALTGRGAPHWFAASDPVGRKLGSGGGTAHLLWAAWRATSEGLPFSAWLRESRKLIIHGGGESRRLPAYAATGKPLMPLPVMRWSRGQRLDQTLLDLQLPACRRVLAGAPDSARVLITSGDVLITPGARLPALPAVDVLGLGLWVTPEEARHFGVFFSPRSRPGEWAFFLQKPAPHQIRELGADHVALVDTGMWLLSDRAVRLLLRRSGWDPDSGAGGSGQFSRFELYDQMGLALGHRPAVADPEINALSCAVAALPHAGFLHFGTSRQCIESLSRLQNQELDETKLGWAGARRHPDQYLQNAEFHFPLRRDENHTLWVENAHVPASWQLAHEHFLTGIPANDWSLRLPAGVCLDAVPVGETGWCLRGYGLDDAFRGALAAAETRWFGRSAIGWFQRRGLDPAGAGVDLAADIFEAPLFPVFEPEALDADLVNWLLASDPPANEALAGVYRKARRLSARELLAGAAIRRLYSRRDDLRRRILQPMLANARWSVFARLDLDTTARDYAVSGHSLPEAPVLDDDHHEPLGGVHERMFRGAVRRWRDEAGWEAEEQAAFARLRSILIDQARLERAQPRCTVQEDQIVWGRSPARLDLAGGWTDTPPYCLEHGGCVLNLAVNLNGQPPIQVFARRTERPEIVLRSIDLGAEQRISTHAGLRDHADPTSAFSVARAALGLAGFLPEFHQDGGRPTLREQLDEFGGGLEISLLAAVPKGSGLGTSSILAATLLGTIADLCGLGWDRQILFKRTLALEQMLTTGGGWQDQAGGLFRGLKLIETAPGLDQTPTLRWLPDHLFEAPEMGRTALLYYTGITRMAKNILGDIVRQIFLNSPAHLELLDAIGRNARQAFEALQRGDLGGLVGTVRESWRLNRQLDAGTNPPAVQAVLDRIAPQVAAAKLLGAGGGGFLLIFAHDEAAAARIRALLEGDPPNPRARFVRFELSPTGLQITRS